MRPLEGDHRTQNDSLHVQSLRGKVPPTGGNPCTHIPGRGSGRCAFGMDVEDMQRKKPSQATFYHVKAQARSMVVLQPHLRNPLFNNLQAVVLNEI
ncbi:unnamed protein product [Malus baccata var. baccata]